jgi:molybdenum cofactor synthesis domain-containing protein
MGGEDLRAAIISINTARAAGDGTDESGPALAAFVGELGGEVAGADLIADEQSQIEARLRHWCDDERVDLVLTSGGTGFSPTDVTPEATRAVIEREAPGIAEAMRTAWREHTPNWMLSRAVAGARGRTLIVNFPGNPRSIRQTSDDALATALPHALALLAGEDPDEEVGRTSD